MNIFIYKEFESVLSMWLVYGGTQWNLDVSIYRVRWDGAMLSSLTVIVVEIYNSMFLTVYSSESCVGQ